MLRKWVVGLWVCIFCTQIAEGAPLYLFRVTFTDKKKSPALEAASGFLSQRSLERRHRQGIRLNETDIPVSSSYIEQVQAATGGTVKSISKWLNNCILAVDDSIKITDLKDLPFVAATLWVGYYDSNSIKRVNHTQKTSLQQKLTGNPAYYGTAWAQTDLLNGDCLHDQGRKGQGMLIAVLDDGFYYVNTAPAFDTAYKSGRIIDTRNFVQGGADVYSDFYTHGTQVLSTIIGNIPNTYVGAAPLAQFALYATEDQAHEWPVEMDNMVAAFERADSIGVDIISTSTGYNNFDPPFQAQSITQAQMDGKTTVAAIGANIAASKGILLVVTAGNEGSGGLLTPGDADSVLTIGNVDASKVPAGNSGYGPNAAGHIKPEVCALGQPGYVMTTGTNTFPVSGTSIATPQIAGFAACLWQGSIGKTNSQLKTAIIESAHLYPNPQMPQLGYGVPDFCAADVILDIPTAPEKAKINVFPNPISEKITVSVNVRMTQRAFFSLSDITGKILLQTEEYLHTGINTTSFKVADWAPGIYFCRVKINEGTFIAKLIKH